MFFFQRRKPRKIDQSEHKDSLPKCFRRRSATGNGNMATGSTCISESIIDIIQIPTANLGFSITASTTSTLFLLGDCNNDRQPETVVETWGNVCIHETMTDTVKITTANLEYSTVASSKEELARPPSITAALA